MRTRIVPDIGLVDLLVVFSISLSRVCFAARRLWRSVHRLVSRGGEQLVSQRTTMFGTLDRDDEKACVARSIVVSPGCGGKVLPCVRSDVG